jgi:hypothetical protein
MAPLPRIAKSWVLIVAIVLLFAAAATFGLHHAQKQRNGPDAILERADHLAWLGNWMQAAPLYKVAEAFRGRSRFSPKTWRLRRPATPRRASASL